MVHNGQHAQHYPIAIKEYEASCQHWSFFGLRNEPLGNSCKPAAFVRLYNISDSQNTSTPRFVELVGKRVKEYKSWLMSHDLGACRRVPAFDSHKLTSNQTRPRRKTEKSCIASVGELSKHATNTAFGIESTLGDKCPAT